MTNASGIIYYIERNSLIENKDERFFIFNFLLMLLIFVY
jgi:hypothetical protein